MSKQSIRALFFLAASLGTASFGCTADDSGVEVHVSQQKVDVRGASMAIRATDSNGDDADIESVEVEVQDKDGNWKKVGHDERDGKDARLDVVLVADNSGSQKSVAKQIRSAAKRFNNELFELGDLSRVGLVRVSTESSVLSELTEDPNVIDGAVDAMHTSNGWTALYDGVRMASEVLDRGWEEADEDACRKPVFRGILTFTNGGENNSRGEMLESKEYPGDGVDTTLEQLIGTKVHGSSTPVFAVGIGKDVEKEPLQELAKGTGGLYTSIDGYDQLSEALAKAAERVWKAKLVCIPKDKEPGCDGVNGSGKVLDACGVCGGDGLSCLGCDGMPNSGATYDQCGMCGGDGKSCLGCDGVPYSGKKVDECGVCGGNNECLGCDSVPYSGKTWDAMGVCGGDGSSGAFCDKKKQKRYDACGVCGGNGKSCAGCDGRPNSEKRLDSCGICGGDDTRCRGCDGKCNSKKKYDECGVCGGDGSECNSDKDEDNDEDSDEDGDSDEGGKGKKKTRVTIHANTKEGPVTQTIEIDL